MPSSHQPIPPPPQPTKVYFDPYHSSAIGHQIHAAKLSGSTSWRDSRTHKLSHQFKDDSGRGGRQYLSDLVGAGSENFRNDGRKDNGDWEKGASGLREEGWQDIRLMMGGSRKRSSDVLKDFETGLRKKLRNPNEDDENDKTGSTKVVVTSLTENDRQKLSTGRTKSDTESSTTPDKPRQIFRNLTIYLNGSTAPLVSDHKLKQLFVQHGGNTSLALSRRTVTHVVLGDTCGGGLSFSKIQKEVSNVRGKGIKFINALWILDSIEKGIRQPEGKYACNTVAKRIGGSNQPTVAKAFALRSKQNLNK